MSRILIVGSLRPDRDAAGKLALDGWEAARHLTGDAAAVGTRLTAVWSEVDAITANVEAHRPDFEQTCRRLGALLAGRGHEILVCSDKEGLADRLVVEGANADAKPGRPAKVWYYASDHEFESAGQSDFGYPADRFSGVVCQREPTREGWFATYNTAIRQADAVISLGGTPRGTGGALYVALAQSTPVLAIPAFGGFSRELWNEFDDAYNTLPSDDQIALLGTKPLEIAGAALRSVEALIAGNPFPKPRRGLQYLAIPLVMAAFTAAWVALITIGWADDGWVPYAVAGVTAMAGMAFRYVNDDALNRVAYAGVARVSKDAARVIGTLLGIFVLVYLFSLQTTTGEDTTQLFAAWLAVAGFASGFLIEETIGALKNALGSAVGAGLKKKA